jgi:hypothetical protein
MAEGPIGGPKRDAKLESNTLRRRQGKRIVRQEEQAPDELISAAGHPY